MGLSKIGAAVACLSLAFSSGCYYARLAKGQLDVMLGTVPLSQVVNYDNKNVSLLPVVSQVKDFAVDVVGLDPTSSYSEYYPADQEGMTFVVTAAERFGFRSYDWCFPLFGCLPYKGFFDRSEALDLEARLKSEGLDTFVFSSSAYSTLGWFDDPVTPFMLDRGIYGLAETIAHEMTHQRVYVANQGDFNEELASFVGEKAAGQFMVSIGIDPSAIVGALEMSRERNELFSLAIDSAVYKLVDIYGSGKSEEHMLSARDVVFEDLRSEALRIYPGSSPDMWDFNNARLLNERRYSSDSGRIQRLWNESGESWPEFWKAVDSYVSRNFH